MRRARHSLRGWLEPSLYLDSLPKGSSQGVASRFVAEQRIYALLGGRY
jgi:hypothetical protein